MKKKIIVFGLISLLLIATTIAVTLNNRNLTVSKSLETQAIALGIDVYNTTDYQKGDLYKRCLVTLSDYNLPCSNYMDESVLDNWEESTMNNILQVEIERAERRAEPTPTKSAEGQTTISS